MKVLNTINNVRSFLRKERARGRSIGFVPTMGYLHQGHLSLIRAADNECDTVVVSVFVNPTQFGPGEDYGKYPRDMGRDKRLAEEAGADLLFAPEAGEMYPEGADTVVEVGPRLTGGLCAAGRPGHFRGVATVVAKLFNIVLPDKAYFGQKDAQQAAVIRRMVRNLNMPVEIRVMPTVREDDGLAESSRNIYLSAGQRQKALSLYRALRRAREMVDAGRVAAGEVREEMLKVLNGQGGVDVEYVEIVDAEDLQPVGAVRNNTLIAVAAKVGDTRLIDNVIIDNIEKG